MDAIVQKFCSSCSHPYFLTKTQPQLKGRIPLILRCSHSICEGCVKKIVKLSEPLLCNTCDTEVMLTPAEVKMIVDGDARSIFPINVFLVGELTLLLSQQATVMSVGDLLGSSTDINNNSEAVALVTVIKQHFLNLQSMVQQMEAKVMKRVDDINSERSSLETALTEVVSGIKKTKILLHKVNSALEPKNIDKVCFDSLLKESKEILDMPWFLAQQVDANGDIKGYSLLRTSEIEDEVPDAPKAVFAPNLPRESDMKISEGSGAPLR